MPNELEETHISNIVDLKDTGFGYTLSVQIPPKVEYSLTDRGRSLISVIDTMCEWGEMNSI